MSKLICNLPAIEVWVRKEYLRDGQDGHGEFVKGIWVSCKSLPGRAFTLRHICQSMVRYLINSLSVHSAHHLRHQHQTLIYITFSFGIVWIIMSLLYKNNLLVL